MTSLSVHILTEGFLSPNGRAFLFPILVHRKLLRQFGVEVMIFTDHKQIRAGCDALIVDSKYFRQWWTRDVDAILKIFTDLRTYTDRLLYFDTTDSSGWVQTELLPLVDAYCKSQLLSDRRQYLQPMYGHRPFSNYYHQVNGVTDKDPEYSKAVEDENDLHKLRLSWNSGLADYSLMGLLRMGLYQRILFPDLKYPTAIESPAKMRTLEVSCRMGTQYPRDSVAYQRRRIREILQDRMQTNKLSRRKYFSEMCTAKVVVSPFGFGEITLKDFEVFLTGGLLFKPDMSHMKTWPDLFVANETMITHSWDLDDIEERLEAILLDDNRRTAIATEAQNRYLKHLHQGEIFANHFKRILGENRAV